MSKLEEFALAHYQAVHRVRLRRHGFRKALRTAAMRDPWCDEESREYMHDEQWKRNTNVVPDGFRLVIGWDSKGCAVLKRVEAVEVEDTSKMSDEKLSRYASLAWWLDEWYVGLVVIPTDRYGNCAAKLSTASLISGWGI